MPTRAEMNSLAQEIIGSYEVRVEGVAQIRKATQEQLRELAQNNAQRKSDVSAQLTGYDEAHATMSRQLRSDLAHVAPDLHQIEAQRERETQQEIAQRKSDVASHLQELGEINAGGRAAWQVMVATMQAKSAGAIVVAEAPSEVAPTPFAVEEVAPAAAMEEAAVEEEAVEVGEVTEELASQSERGFEYLAHHPYGTRLTELEQEFGLGRFQAARVVRHLMNEGKAEKRDLLYFAI
ncbi:MAG: hypothetical protein ABID84_04365 [Chloroflexota bacterium]